MRQWLNLLKEVSRSGERRDDRTGIGTKALFGVQVAFENTEAHFPAVTTKKLAAKQCFAELACFLKGHETLVEFHEEGCTIWDANANAPYWKPRYDGDLGRIYGVQWRRWEKTDHYGHTNITDQLGQLVESLRTSPTSRRHVVTAWNPGELGSMCLPPCHTMFQAFVANDGSLDLLVTMRSVDLFLGLPFDIASYALLQRLLAQDCGLKSRRLIFSLGDAHIYNNHAQQVATVLAREPFEAPKLALAKDASIDKFHYSMAELQNYRYHGVVSAEMAV